MDSILLLSESTSYGFVEDIFSPTEVEMLTSLTSTLLTCAQIAAEGAASNFHSIEICYRSRECVSVNKWSSSFIAGLKFRSVFK